MSVKKNSYNGIINKRRRKILELFSLSHLSLLVLLYNLLYSATKKIINPNLTEEQKKSC